MQWCIQQRTKAIEASQLGMNIHNASLYREVMSRGKDTSMPRSAAYFLAHFLVRIEARIS